MKKIFIVMLALFLAVPAISYAGSATSRWDLTIGGTMKFDFGYVDQNQGSSYAFSNREPASGFDSADYDYGNLLAGTGETSLSFFVKGPDAWNAKTSMFLLGDFTGVWAGTTYGTFTMLAATMTLDWQNTSLTMGVAGPYWGSIPFWGGNIISFGAFNVMQKGTPIQPQISLTRRIGKNFTVKGGLFAAGIRQGNTGANTRIDEFSRSPYPQLHGDLSWSSPACGKVGPWQLLFGVGGFYGQEKKILNDATGVPIPLTFAPAPAAAGISTYGAAGVVPDLDDENVDAWEVAFRFLVPIIPEKAGNKTGAWFIDGIVWTGQNSDGQHGPASAFGSSSYLRGTDFVAPTIKGGMAHSAFYFTDALWVNAAYGYYKLNASNARFAANPGFVKNRRDIFVSLNYQMNPAMRLGLEYGNLYTKYGAATTNLKKDGTLQDLRFAAWYFF